MMSKLAQKIGVAALSLSVLTGASRGNVLGSGPPAARSVDQQPDYHRYGPYSYSDAQEKAAQIRRDHPRAYVQVVRENQGWFVHVIYR